MTLDADVLAELRASAAEPLDDGSWVLTLDEHDEPPPFTRSEQMYALKRVAIEVRGPMLLLLALEHLDAIVRVISSANGERRYAVCVTVSVSHLRELARGELVCPVRVWVDPEDIEPSSEYVMGPPMTEEALEVSRWISQLDDEIKERFVVTELFPVPDDELRRVYVGFRNPPSARVHS